MSDKQIQVTKAGEQSMEAVLYDFQNDDFGDKRSDFIARYLPFIVKQVALALGRYVASENDEAFIVGLEAFDEAIDRYQSEKGSFVNLASLVIQSRIKDYMRKEMKRSEREVLMDPHGEEMAKLPHVVSFEESINFREDVLTLVDQLQHFHITLEDVAEQAPKHKLTRKMLLAFCQGFSKQKEWVEVLFQKRQVPLKASVGYFDVTQKQIKSHRAYVIAVIVVFHKELDTLATYLSTQGAAHV